MISIINMSFFFLRFAIGDYRDHFCLQSVSKCLHYPIVLEDLTAEVVSYQIIVIYRKLLNKIKSSKGRERRLD